MQFFKTTAKFFGLVRATERGDIVTVSGVDGELLSQLLSRIFKTNAINKAMFTSVTRTSLSFERFFVPDLVFMFSKLITDPSVKWGAKRTAEKIVSELLEKTWFKVSTLEHKSRIDIKQLRKLNWKPLPIQLEFLEVFGERIPKYDINGVLLAAGAGTGKAQPLDSPIHTPTGWITMGDVKIGTIVSTPDGASAKVTNVHPQGEKDIFTVRFEDGRKVQCCDDHLWRVYSKRWVRNGDGWKILSLSEIKEYLTLSSYRDSLYVQLTEPVLGSDDPLPVDPYVLGIMIGDGHIAKGHVRISSPDQFIIDEVTSRLGSDYELYQCKRKSGTPIDYYVVTKQRANRWHPSNLMKGITELGLAGTLSHTKFIPDLYLDSSVQNRMALLQGLMDSDGTVGVSKGRGNTEKQPGKGGSISYCTVSKQLALNVQELVRSLGGLCKISIRYPTYTYRGEKRDGKIAYQLSIRLRNPSEAFRLPRKKNLTPKNYQYQDCLRLRIREIEFDSRKNAQCIEVDHPDHLYITDHYTVTHNTFSDIMVATCLIPPEVAEVKIVISPKKAIHLVWEKTVQNVFKKVPKYWVSDSNTPMPIKDTEYYIFNFEALDKAIELAKQLVSKNVRYFVIVDESHNFADRRSARTQKLEKLQTLRDDVYFVWASGSPILKSAAELSTFLRCSDKRFTPEAEKRFIKIHNTSPGRANEIFRHRFGMMMAYLIPKSAVSKTKPRIVELPVKLPPNVANKFLMDTVREDMKKFIVERIEYYDSQMKPLRSTVNHWLDYHDTKLTTREDKRAFSQYLKDIKIISRNPDLMIREVAERARTYERTKLLPSLPPTSRKSFRSALSAIKNIKLKVRGEALGTVLSKRRSECTAALAVHCRPEELIKDSLSKTIFFASSVLPIKTLSDYLETNGFTPLMVYGATNSQLVQIMGEFETNPTVNPVCATMQSLSEAVPVTAASTVVLLNRPFRQGTYDQVIARADRLGQKHPVTIIEVTLDTDGRPNVSSRTDEILSSVREIINSIVGEEFAGPSIDDREYKDLIDASDYDPSVADLDSFMV